MKAGSTVNWSETSSSTLFCVDELLTRSCHSFCSLCLCRTVATEFSLFIAKSWRNTARKLRLASEPRWEVQECWKTGIIVQITQSNKRKLFFCSAISAGWLLSRLSPWTRIRKPFVATTLSFWENRFWKNWKFSTLNIFYVETVIVIGVARCVKLFYEPSRIQWYKLLLHYEHLNRFKQRSKGKRRPKCTHFCRYLSIYFQN